MGSDSDRKGSATTRELICSAMAEQGPCRAGDIAERLDLNKGAVAAVMYELFSEGYARRLARGLYQFVRSPDEQEELDPVAETAAIEAIMGATMPAKIMSLLRAGPDQALSFREIKKACGYTRQATGAVLSNLVKRGIVARPRRGFYRLRYVPGPHGDRGEAVLRYLLKRPWSRISEIRREADRYIAADTVRKILTRFGDEGKVQRDGFFYALSDETRTAQHCRDEREPPRAERDGRRPGRIGRPPRTRIALLNIVKACTQPHSVDVLAKQAKLSVGAVRSVLSQLTEEGLVRTEKMRADREDMRLVYHYEYVWPETPEGQ